MSEPTFALQDLDSVVEDGQPGALVIVGQGELLCGEALLARLPPALSACLPRLCERLQPGDGVAHASQWLDAPHAARLEVGLLSSRASRHNASGRPDLAERFVRELVEAEGLATDPAPLRVVAACRNGDEALSAAAAVARALPRYSRATSARPVTGIRLALWCDGNEPERASFDALCQAVRSAARWHDLPAAELSTQGLVAEAQALARDVGASCRVLEGEALASAGLHGLWSVGRAATEPPALVVLSHLPADTNGPGVAWVGKGIVYDSGGLSLKTNAEMLGMKGDMGGAAAVLAAFGAAVKLGAPRPLHALLCIAENAIGPEALRPDDILTLYSGKSVEVRNSDCEGRVVLADGIAYAARELAPETIIDLATLTDGAVVATGRRHAAVISNAPELEASAVIAGRALGELVHPLPYCPELYRAELSSAVADMTNAARDPQNANASCAAQFIAEHLGDHAGSWLHIDLEGPARADNGRGTGFGVGLLLRLLGAL